MRKPEQFSLIGHQWQGAAAAEYVIKSIVVIDFVDIVEYSTHCATRDRAVRLAILHNINYLQESAEIDSDSYVHQLAVSARKLFSGAHAIRWGARPDGLLY
jgi:hypothetical protein